MIKMYTKNYSIIHVIIFIQKGLQNCIQSTITLNNLSFSFGSHASGHSIRIWSFRQMYYWRDKYKTVMKRNRYCMFKNEQNQNQRILNGSNLAAFDLSFCNGVWNWSCCNKVLQLHFLLFWNLSTIRIAIHSSCTIYFQLSPCFICDCIFRGII